LAAKT